MTILTHYKHFFPRQFSGHTRHEQDGDEISSASVALLGLPERGKLGWVPMIIRDCVRFCSAALSPTLATTCSGLVEDGYTYTR
jgi:hypothetical protein